MTRSKDVPARTRDPAPGRASAPNPAASAGVQADDLAEQRGASLPRLVALMQRLLGPGGCPWDQEQTLSTLRPFVIEEAYEVVDAIEQGSPDALREELGDLLLQIVFQSELARQQGWFGPDDVIAAVHDKMVSRHPHVFGDASYATSGEVLANWEKLKAKEKADRGVLDGVPSGLPALLRGLRASEKAARIGFDWPDAASVRSKLDEELGELDQAVAGDDPQAIHDELGDVLFALANYARKLGQDPELALRDTLDRFTERVQAVERLARAKGQSTHEMSTEALEALWQQVKRKIDTSC